MPNKSIRYWSAAKHRADQVPPLVENRLASAPIRRGGGKPTRNIVGPKHCWAAKSIIDRALALAPNSPEAHLALGIFSYRGHRQYDQALAEFNRTRMTRSLITTSSLGPR
jgi:hypothetical protein